MTFKSLLVKLLPFLFKAATVVWENAPQSVKNAATWAVKATEAAKKYINSPVSEIYQNIALATGSDVSTVKQILPEALLTKAQADIKQGLNDFDYDKTWHNLAADITNQLVTIDWETIALGLIQIAFKIVFKK